MATFVDKNIVNSIQGIPLSARRKTRRTDILADENKSSLLKLVRNTPCYAIALDKYCNIIDNEQISVSILSLDTKNKIFRDELLTILTFKNTWKRYI